MTQCYYSTICRTNKNYNNKYPRRFWFKRFWILSTLTTLIISFARTGDGAMGPGSTGVTLSFNITQITSPLSMDALTGVSSDQCKPWTIDGVTPASLTWAIESRLLLVSISNVYEVRDVTSLGSYFTDLQYTPISLSIENVEISDSEGLGFHLSFNATPICGTSKLPTKILCNDGLVISINKTNPTGVTTQPICAGRYFVSYRYTYSCTNTHFTPPSCKTTCHPMTNSTHCYICDEHDGQQKCCLASAEPTCTVLGDSANVASYQSQTSSQGFGSIGGTALTVVVALSVLSALLLVASLLLSVLLTYERRRNGKANVAKARTNGWMKSASNGVQVHPQKNGASHSGNGTIQNTSDSSPLKLNGGHRAASPVDLDDLRAIAAPSPSVALGTVATTDQHRPASCDPIAGNAGSEHHRRLDVQSLYNGSTRNGRPSVPRARAPLDVIFATHQQHRLPPRPTADSTPKPKSDLGTLF